jgi:hypothetical protein
LLFVNVDLVYEMNQNTCKSVPLIVTVCSLDFNCDNVQLTGNTAGHVVADLLPNRYNIQFYLAATHAFIHLKA